MNNNMSIAFTLRYAELKVSGNDENQAFNLVGEEFIKRIKAIRIIGQFDSRKYYFNDGSTCTYKNGYWKFNSQSKN